MTYLVLHALVLAIILGAPALDRWTRHRYELSTRWRRTR